MSQRMKGENHSFFGKKHTEETIGLLRIIALRRPKSHKPRFKVNVLNTVTGESHTYQS